MWRARGEGPASASELSVGFGVTCSESADLQEPTKLPLLWDGRPGSQERGSPQGPPTWSPALKDGPLSSLGSRLCQGGEGEQGRVWGHWEAPLLPGSLKGNGQDVPRPSTMAGAPSGPPGGLGQRRGLVCRCRAQGHCWWVVSILHPQLGADKETAGSCRTPCLWEPPDPHDGDGDEHRAPRDEDQGAAGHVCVHVHVWCAGAWVWGAGLRLWAFTRPPDALLGPGLPRGGKSRRPASGPSWF